MHRLLAVLVLATLSLLSLVAQVNTGTILGTVTDPSGAAVAGAKVTATNEETNFQRVVETGPDGSFLLTLMPISPRYRVSAELPGFKTFVRTGLGLMLGQNLRVDIVLELGQLAETVEVTGAAPLVDTYSAVRGEVIETQRITELPLNGRNPLQLASLVTGVTAISTRTALDAGNRSGNYVNVNGSRSNETDYQLNGVRFAGSYTNSGLNYPNPDALEEFKLITSPNSAEYGLWSGSVFSAVLKSGTNEIHGTVFEFLRNDALNARNFFAATKPTLRQNQFGVSGGGPIMKDRVFGFGSYQGLRVRETALASSFPLTTEERQGLITSSRPVIDPTSGQAFPRDAQGRYMIPTSRFDSTSKYLIDNVIPVAPAGGLLVSTGSRKVDVNQFTGKFDFNISDSDQLYVTGLYDKTTPVNPFFYGPYPTIGTTDQKQRIYVLSVSETHTFSPSVINEFRFGLTGQEEKYWPQNQLTPAEMGIKNWDYNGIENENFTGNNINTPYIPVSGRFTLGNFIGGPWREGGDNWQITDMARIQTGKHSFIAGLDFYKRKHRLDANVFNTGAFTFNSQVTGNATADFLLGKMGSLTRIRYVNHPGYEGWTHGYFVQDDWKIHPRFTLNLGLRYELLFPFKEWRALEDTEIGWNVHGGLPIAGEANYRYGVQSTVMQYAPPGLVFVGDRTPDFPDGMPRGMLKLDKKQIQPRIGFAWDPFGDGKTSIRSSFGLFSNAQFVDMPAQFGQNLPFIVITGTNMPQGELSDPYRGLTPFPPATSNNLLNDPLFFTPYLPASGYGWDQNYGMPRIMNMTFNVQRQIIPHVMLEVGYVGKLSRHLQYTRNINTAVYIPGQSTIGNTDQRRRLDNKNFQKIDWQDSGANANFHSLQTTLRWQLSRGLSFLSSYTWSHSIDIWSTINIQSVICQNAENCSLDRGSSDFDRRHVYRFSAMYDLPSPNPSSKPLHAVLGGWQLSGIMTAQSGSPFGLASGRDNSLSGNGADRPDLVGDPYLSGDRSRGDKIAQYFNKAAFAANQEGTFGNFGRNVLTGPRYFNTDLGLFKNFNFTEMFKLQFRAEFFNAFNQVHLGTPNGNIISPGFARITSAGDPRFIQFGLKLGW